MTLLEVRSRDRKNNLDFIRFIAAVLVILSHSYPLTANNGSEMFAVLSKGQWTFGGIAVAIFFVISGFLVSRSFENSTIRQYAINRALRIYPGLAVAIIVSVIFGAFLSNLPISEYFGHDATISYFKNITALSVQYSLPGVFETNLYANAVNGSIWTIPYEVLCYIAVGLLGYYGLLKNEKSILLVLLLLLIISFVLPAAYLVYNIKGFLLGTLVDLSLYFCMGMVFYAYRKKIMLSTTIALLSSGILAFTFFTGGFKLAFLFFGTYLVFYFGYSDKLRLYNFSKYGDFSYGLYIYAFPVQQTVQFITDNQTSPYKNFLISLPVTLILAICSWYAVERPALRYKVKSGRVAASESTRQNINI